MTQLTLKARPSLAQGRQVPNLWDITRGAGGPWLAQVSFQGDKLVLVKGKVNVENAADAVFLHQLEQTELKGIKERRKQEVPEEPKTYQRQFYQGHTPQVIVTLGPDGGLQAELPGAANGQRRVVPLRSSKVAETLFMILIGQNEGEPVEIGNDGAPTAAQVRHWERHQQFKDDRCRFCIAEGHGKATSKRQKRKVLIAKSGDVEINRLPALPRKRGEVVNQRTQKSIEELDL